jgi:hydrogenase expression/formation protein HypD
MNLIHLSEYRNKDVCQTLSNMIRDISTHEIRLMEVCGTHTMAISRNGIRKMMPEIVTLLSGPGCPVCVTSQQEIDQFIALAKYPDVILTTFGDVMRVPGSESSLQLERANGADIRIVYSATDSLDIAEKNPDKQVVFLGVGFETTGPTIAATVFTAANRKIENFSVMSAHKLVPLALKALMENKKVNVDGFICPGHVSVMIGADAYVPIVENYHIPCVIAGFEPADILHAILLIIEQIENGYARVDIAYKRAVNTHGNPKAMDVLLQVFEACDATWRGIGLIPDSGLRFRDEFKQFDATSGFNLVVPDVPEPAGCVCGEILTGLKSPHQCALFAKTCTPENPIGPCMVSSEGTCAAYYKYQL